MRSLKFKKKKYNKLTEEDLRYEELLVLFSAGFITKPIRHPKIFLKGESKIAIARYTPDFEYQLLKKFSIFKNEHVNKKIIEEYKGSVDMWAYKRADYSIFRRWVIVDYPEYIFVENIAGKMQFPKIRLPKC